MPQVRALRLLTVLGLILSATGCGASVGFVHPVPHHASYAGTNPHVDFAFAEAVKDRFDMAGEGAIGSVAVHQFRDSLETGFESTFAAATQVPATAPPATNRARVDLLSVEPRLVERGEMHHGDARTRRELRCQVRYTMRITIGDQAREVEETVISEETAESVDSASTLLRSGLSVMFTHMRHTVIESLSSAGVAPPAPTDG